MQSQKTRMFLLAIVVLAVPGVAIYNAMNAPKGPQADGHDHGSEKKLETKEVSAAERKEQSKKLDEALKGRPVARIDEVAGGEGLAKKPTILIEKWNVSRPTPNDSGTAIQWYRKDSRSAMKSEQNAASRGDN